jgi:GNAT superfamily N-acetyltransferase
VVVQGRLDAIGDVARDAVARSGRDVHALLGPHALTVAARAALGLADRPVRMDSREDLFALSLDALRVPPPLADGRWLCRRPVDGDREELARWSVAYEVEALYVTRTPEDEAEALRDFRPAASQWVLVADGERVATTRFNAELPDTVQVGGVYTPPARRGRGFARAAVAGSLLDARARGATRSILFTDEHNYAARSAYLALGYEIVGDYGIVIFA